MSKEEKEILYNKVKEVSKYSESIENYSVSAILSFLSASILLEDEKEFVTLVAENYAKPRLYKILNSAALRN